MAPQASATPLGTAEWISKPRACCPVIFAHPSAELLAPFEDSRAAMHAPHSLHSSLVCRPWDTPYLTPEDQRTYCSLFLDTRMGAFGLGLNPITSPPHPSFTSALPPLLLLYPSCLRSISDPPSLFLCRSSAVMVPVLVVRTDDPVLYHLLPPLALKSNSSSLHATVASDYRCFDNSS